MVCVPEVSLDLLVRYQLERFSQSVIIQTAVSFIYAIAVLHVQIHKSENLYITLSCCVKFLKLLMLPEAEIIFIVILSG